MRCVWSLLKKTTYRTMIMWRLARSSNKLNLKLSFGSVGALRIVLTVCFDLFSRHPECTVV